MPRSEKQSILLRLLVVIVLLTLTACGGSDGGESAAPAADSGATTATEATTTDTESTATEAPAADTAATTGDLSGSLRVSSVAGAMHGVLETIAGQYEEQHPGVDVTIEDEPEGGAFQALIAAGNQPDLVITSFGPALGRLAAQEALVPLEDLEGAPALLDRLEPSAVEQFFGSNYYIPIGADITMLIYNKQLFAEAGLDPESPPTTWDEFLADAEAIYNLPDREDGTKVYGTVFWNEALGWGGWYWNMLQPIYLNGNQDQCALVNRLGTDIDFDDPACNMTAFFEFLKEAQQYAPPTMETNFFSRSIGMWPQYGYSWEPNLQTAADEPMVMGEDVGVAPVPVPNEGDQPYTTYGGRAAVIMRTNPEQETLAWDFLQYLMTDEVNMQFITQLGYLPVVTALQGDPYFADPARQPFVDMLQYAVLPQQFSAADTVASAVQGVIQQAVVEDQMSAEQAAEQAAEAARNALESAQQ
ncbi:MAG: extracellular solute-binding protein [Caldilineaceae bacterium]|nr:extracellular solute-binding protein [Caldilineaceae bacterium]